MAIRRSKMPDRMPVHVEVARADELPAGTPAPTRLAAERDADGRLLAGPGTSELARAAAKAAHEGRQLERLLGLWAPPEGHAYTSYARLAREWRDAHITQLGATVGGGRIGPGPASIISSAALQLAASRWLFDRGSESGDARALVDASRLANDARQNVLAAHEIAAREAESREQDPGRGAAGLMARLGHGGK